MQHFLMFFIMVVAARLENGLPSRLYIWNVGQGQWVTWVKSGKCLHFDMGGEWAPKKSIQRLCGNLDNQLYLSHADMDHIRFIRWGIKNLAGLCIHVRPREHLNAEKQKILANLRQCQSQPNGRVLELLATPPHAKANDLSRVYLLKGARRYGLIPGDSTIKAENIWAKKLSPFQIKILLLGHHGSHSSTGDDLLSRLPYLKQTICSARQRRYGHPHRLIQERLAQKRLPLVRTEAWGTLSYEL